MAPHKIKYYLINCFILLIPVIIWNILFRSYLPEPYLMEPSGKLFPSILKWIEVILTILILAVPFFLRLKVKNKLQQLGLIIYFIGVIVYIFAWRPIILYPNGDWSNSLVGYISLSITPVIFLTGIGMIGEKLVFNITYHRSIYILLSIILVFLKTSYAILVYYNIY